MRELVQVSGGSDSEADSVYFVGELSVNSIDSAEWHSVIRCNNSKIRMKLDTGAATNVMPLKIFKKLLPEPKLAQSETVLKAYGNHHIPHLGKCRLKCSVNKTRELCAFYVVDTNSPPILGVKACMKLGLIQRGVHSIGSGITAESLYADYKDVCGGLGCFKEPYHIQLKDTIFQSRNLLGVYHLA